MNRGVKSCLVRSVSALPLLLAAVPAHAQQEPADGSGVQEPADDAGVQMIVVTAQRRQESLQDVPVSVNVVTADTLRERNLNDLQQITLAAPSLQIGQENTFSIRGVGTLAFQQTVDPAVAVSLDEVSLARTLLSENLFLDVEQIEVLNGPQGLLFGRNASAGLLNITTTRPKLGRTMVDGHLEYNVRDTTPGNGDGVIARTNFNLPVTKNSAFRLNLAYQHQNPVTRAVVSGPGSNTNRRSFEVRGKYLAQPTDALEFYLIGNYAETNGTAGLFDRTYRALAPGSANTDPLAADGYVASPDLLEYKADGANFRNLRSYGGQARVSYLFANDWELINLAAYKAYDHEYAFDQDYTTSNGVSLSTLSSDFHQFSNELRLALPASDRLSGQVGLYYLTFEEESTTLTGGDLYIPSFVLPNFPFCVGADAQPGAFPPNCSVSNDYAVGSDTDSLFKSRTYAAFGQFTYELTPQLRLLAGGRLTRDEIEIDFTQNVLDYFVRFGGPSGTYSAEDGHTDFSWKLGAQFEPSPQVMVYANYAKGYKGPGANNSAATANANLIVEPETSRNIELGAKTSWLDQRVIFNVSLFRTKYRDYQASAFNAQQASFVITNAASLTSQGAEVTANLRPFAGLSVDAALTFLDSEFDDFPGAQCYPGQPDCSANGTFNARGLSTPLAADLTSSIGVNYRFPVFGDADVVIGGDWYHRSSVNYTVSTNPLTALGPVDIFGARVSLDLNENLQFVVFCKNCGDERVPNFIYNDPGDAASGLNSTVQTFGFNSVRTIGASVDFRF
ncbi:TonB-dependent receptor [uncultured Croceicoccus sp.]|uniref:TonB-dependent receptor n=1 Tax=uncultured Croceicoccus sp. TaxID=1295329 RepID=UPI00261D414A|nr:TonB-dependent receptor [uncultured Croceicoccus sp.]